MKYLKYILPVLAIFGLAACDMNPEIYSEPEADD